MNNKIVNLKKIENSIPVNKMIYPKKYDEIALYLASRLLDIVPFQLCSDIVSVLFSARRDSTMFKGKAVLSFQ